MLLKKVNSTKNTNEVQLHFGVLSGFRGLFLGIRNIVFVKTAKAVAMNAITKNEAVI